MKWKWQIPAVPGVVIAIPAILLGAGAAFWIAPGVVSYGSRPHASGASFPEVAALGILALVVAALVLLNALGERRYQMERELLEAFLEHIPDNVFFKDRESRFVRVGRAMAKYVGLSSPAEVVGRADCKIL